MDFRREVVKNSKAVIVDLRANGRPGRRVAPGLEEIARSTRQDRRGKLNSRRTRKTAQKYGNHAYPDAERVLGGEVVKQVVRGKSKSAADQGNCRLI